MRSNILGIGAMLSISALTFGLVFAAPAQATDCNQDIGNLMKKRQGVIDELNKLAKSSPKGQLDPQVSCPKLRSLAASEKDLLGYMIKNKDWCMVPDNAVTNIEASSKRTSMIAERACKVAEQIKKGQDALTNAAPKLPTGPL